MINNLGVFMKYSISNKLLISVLNSWKHCQILCITHVNKSLLIHVHINQDGQAVPYRILSFKNEIKNNSEQHRKGLLWLTSEYHKQTNIFHVVTSHNTSVHSSHLLLLNSCLDRNPGYNSVFLRQGPCLRQVRTTALPVCTTMHFSKIVKDTLIYFIV